MQNNTPQYITRFQNYGDTPCTPEESQFLARLDDFDPALSGHAELRRAHSIIIGKAVKSNRCPFGNQQEALNVHNLMEQKGIR